MANVIFHTDKGIAVPAVTADQMREIDRIPIEETGPNLFQMMENAGRNLASLTIELLGNYWQRASVVVLAGTGGNGGGGICAARHLANRGVRVRLCITEPERLGTVPSLQRKICQSTPGEEVSLEQLSEMKVDIVLDAVLGYSLNGAPRGRALDLIRWANVSGIPILSLDIPSGIDATTGETPGEHVRSRWTMTLALPKTGLLPKSTGELFLADIGIPVGVYRDLGLPYTSPFDHRYVVPLKARP
ncbi:MAG: NAD(P)H-hydrate epimerase [Ignavibacteriae bacterium]|nr:NAD(P)H-hydrate epimerase [Ignavibacteriota bacterium]